MRLRTIATASLVVTLSSAGANAQEAAPAGSFDAQSAVETFLSSPEMFGASSATVGSVTREGDVVTATDVSMTWTWQTGDGPMTATDANVTVTIPSLEIDSLTYDDVYHAAEIMVPSATTQVVVTSPTESLDYTFEIDTYQTENVSWSAIPPVQENAAAPVSRFAPLIDAMLKHSYDSASIQGLNGTLVADGQTQTFTYGPSTYSNYKDGVLESFTLGAGTSTQTLPTPPSDVGAAPMPAELTMNYGGVVGETIDMKPLVALLTGSGEADGAQTFIGSMTFGKVDVKAGDLVTFSMGETSTSGITVDPSRGPILTQADAIFTALDDNEEPDVPTLVNMMLNLYGAFGVGSYEQGGIDVSFPEGTAKLGSFIIENLNASGLGRLALNGASVQSSEISGSLGKLEVADVVFPEREALLAAVMASAAGVQADPATVMAALPYLGRLTISDVAFSDADRGDIALGLFETRAANFISAIPTQISIALEGLSFPAALLRNPMAQGVATAVGADPVQADGTITLGWDEARQLVTLDEDFAVANIGRLQLSAAMSGIPRFVFAEPQRIQEALVTAAIDNVSARFDDQGITNFGMAMVSQQSGMPADQFPTIISQQVGAQVTQLTNNADLASQVSGAIQTYLSDPQSLAIAAAPGNPVPLAQVIGAVMTAPQALPELLGLSIEANSAAQ